MIGVFVDDAPQSATRHRFAQSLAQNLAAELRAFALEPVWTSKGAQQRGPFVQGPLALPAPPSEAPQVAGGIQRLKVPDGDIARVAARVAHELDLVVFAQPEKLHTAQIDAQIAAGLIAGAGRGTLMVPRKWAPHWPPRRALLAWDGRAAASRAAFGALDLLRTAERVLVLGIDQINAAGRKLEAPISLEEAARWLNHHGVQAETLKLQSTAEPAHIVCGVLRERGMDLAVMGAYGRIGGEDLMIGPTTAAILTSAEAPVFFGG